MSSHPFFRPSGEAQEEISKVAPEETVLVQRVAEYLPEKRIPKTGNTKAGGWVCLSGYKWDIKWDINGILMGYIVIQWDINGI